jgi:hypothetical protein
VCVQIVLALVLTVAHNEGTPTGEADMQTNQQVTGTYCGAKFSGVIAEMRRLTVRTDGCFEFMVKLAQPLTVYGHTRDTLCMHAKFDGQPSSYTKFSDALEAA